MADWVQLQKNLREGFSGLAEYERAKRKRQEEYENMINQAIIKAKIEQMYRPPQRWQPTTMEEAIAYERAKGAANLTPSQILNQQKIEYNKGLKEAAEGKLPWETLKRKFPGRASDIRNIRPELSPIEKHPKFQEGWGLPALFSPLKAKIGVKERFLINQIKTEADLAEFMERIDDISEAGYDVNAIMEYFGLKTKDGLTEGKPESYYKEMPGLDNISGVRG